MPNHPGSVTDVKVVLQVFSEKQMREVSGSKFSAIALTEMSSESDMIEKESLKAMADAD